MWAAFDKLLARFRELESLLADPAVVTDHQRYAQLAKEHGSLARSVRPYLEHQQLTEDKKQAEAMLAAETDPEMRAYAEEELAGLQKRIDDLRGKLEEFLLVEPGEDYDS